MKGVLPPIAMFYKHYIWRTIAYRVELILNAHIQWFFCAVRAMRITRRARPVPALFTASGCGVQISVRPLCTEGLARHGARSSDTSRGFRASGLLPLRPHADIGTYFIRRCDGQTLDIACRQEIRNNPDYSGIGNCPSQRRILEPVSGIEPEYSAWKADVLPLNYTGVSPDIPPETVRMSILLSDWSHIRDSNSVHPSCGTLPPRHAPGRDIREEKGGI